MRAGRIDIGSLKLAIRSIPQFENTDRIDPIAPPRIDPH
jgi:hypothetical protein